MWKSQQIDTNNESHMLKMVDMIMDEGDRQSLKWWINIGSGWVFCNIGHYFWQSVAEESEDTISNIA